MNLGLFLKRKRIERNLTQKELGLTLGEINTQYVSNWERGLCSPPSHALDKVMEVLKIKKENLIESMLKDSLLLINAKVYPKKVAKKKIV